jgi:hypothetical protein
VRLKRHSVEVFSLSFLDCICCGFGAIILLLVLTQYGDPIQLEERTRMLKGQVAQLEDQLHEIRGETDLLNRQLEGKEDLLAKERMRAAKLAGDLTRINGQFAASKKEASVTNIVQGELVAAYQSLSEEMKRLLKNQASRAKNAAIAGIPVDSEYIIFVQDTSSSMNTHWQMAVSIMGEILDMYPKVKGLQIMNDQGRYMFGGTKGQWLADTPERRAEIVSRMKSWRPFSQSNPVPGIEEALRTYWAPDKRISIYVLGDEFTGDSIQEAIEQIRLLNQPDRNGRKVARIHAIGYLNDPGYPPYTNIRLAALMRYVCAENNGTFVGITRD